MFGVYFPDIAPKRDPPLRIEGLECCPSIISGGRKAYFICCCFSIIYLYMCFHFPLAYVNNH